MPRFVMYPETGLMWELLHEKMTAEHLGLIPHFLNINDKRTAAEQFNANYQWGGWSPFGGKKWTMATDGTLTYYEPNLDMEDMQDPPLKPLARCSLRNEVIYFYDYAIVAIVQPDASFEVSRMD